MEAPNIYVDMHRIYEPLLLIGQGKDAVLSFDLSAAPHNQDRQRPCIDIPPDSIIDQYIKTMRNAAGFQCGYAVELVMQETERHSTMYSFDVHIVGCTRPQQTKTAL